MPTNIIRTPTTDDLPAILSLTRANRALLAALEPVFWRPSSKADAFHREFVTGQVTNAKLIKRVLERDGQIIGYAVSFEHPSGFYFIDDVCLSEDADWKTDGVRLFASIEERPAIMTAPHLDRARVEAAFEVGLQCISSVRLLRFDQEQSLDVDTVPVEPIQTPDDLATAPMHVWLPAMTPESVAVIGDDRGGYAVVSPSVGTPPIYDPGGTAAIVDRVIGDDRESLLMSVLSFASQRGDAGAILVVDAHDAELAELADRLGARHPVDVFKWPE